jgi:hypothetical protein
VAGGFPGNCVREFLFGRHNFILFLVVGARLTALLSYPRKASSVKIRFFNIAFPEPTLKYFSISLAFFSEATTIYDNNLIGLRL